MATLRRPFGMRKTWVEMRETLAEIAKPASDRLADDGFFRPTAHPRSYRLAVMVRCITNRFASLLRRPLFGTRVVGPDARVDPAAFPDDEFPVHCPKCCYPLRGLPDGRCPECGEPFERGRLLVQEYVVQRQATTWFKSRGARWCRWLILIGITVYFVELLAIGAAIYLTEGTFRPPQMSNLPNVNVTWRTLDWAGQFAMYACFVTAIVIVARTFPRGGKQRRLAVLRVYDEAKTTRQTIAAPDAD